MHSFLCDASMWAKQVPAWAERHRVLNVEIRGHGRSRPSRAPFDVYDLVDDMVAVLDASGVERAVWIGLSTGGFVALRAALTRPSRVAGIAVMDASAGKEPLWNRMKYGAMAQGARLVGIPRFRRQIVRIMFGPTSRRKRPDLVARWSSGLHAFDVEEVVIGLRAIVGRDSVEARLSEIDVPSLILVGTEDASQPQHLSQRMADRIPSAELVLVPEAGHLTALENPDAVTTAVLDFLDREELRHGW
jgi:pimeloyl-ACP methyl ester carboxylesterase